ncbi:uncharacterized protein PG998_006847 [Apiospora kogelbergensis]|uniref:uncharacterized protein n=1 Tax=Apiospora kogelbergensis TaxID=1337665 RepID=UPI00312EA5F6
MGYNKPEDDSSSEHSDEAELFMDSKYQNKRFAQASWLRQHSRSITVHVILLLFNISFFVIILYSTTGVRDMQHSETPFGPQIRYEQREFNRQSVYLHDGSLNHKKPTLNFNGPPRPALEAAWERLKDNDSVRVSAEELGQFAGDDTIISLTDGSGYYTTVAVYHGLHCVQRLHHYLYPDHYYPDLDEDERFTLLRHTEHCLDWLREYLTCNADTTLIPVHWQANHASPTALDWGKHQCVDWTSIEDWMATHAFDPYTPGLLMHPEFGSPYNQSAEATHHNLGAIPVGKNGLQLLSGGGSGH